MKVRRDEILEEMRSIRRLKRGKLTQQTLKRTGADGSRQERGPYHSLQHWSGGRNNSRRVPPEEIERVREAVDGYQKLLRLTEEFAQITEALSDAYGSLLPEKKTSRCRPRGAIH
jgi:hypothetical protein